MFVYGWLADSTVLYSRVSKSVISGDLQEVGKNTKIIKNEKKRYNYIASNKYEASLNVSRINW